MGESMNRSSVAVVAVALVSLAFVGCIDEESPDASDAGIEAASDVGEPDISKGDVESDPGTDAAPDTGSDCETDSDRDGLVDCDERQMCTDPNDGDTDRDGLGDLEEIQHQTDPCDPDSDGDGVEDDEELRLGFDPNDEDSDGDGTRDGDEWIVSACEETSPAPVRHYEHARGDWTLALPPAFDNYASLEIDGAEPKEAAAVYDDPSKEVAGFLLSQAPAEDQIGSVAAFEEELETAVHSLGSISNHLGPVEIRTHDGHLAATGEYVVELSEPVAPRTLREQLLVTAAPFSEGDVGGMPAADGQTRQTYRVELTLLQRTDEQDRPTRRLVLVAVTPESTESEGQVDFQMEHLTGTANIAARDASTTDECWRFKPLTTVPKMDVYFVVDGDGPEGYADRIRQFARKFEQAATRHTFDHRFGVTNMQPGNGGRLVGGTWQRSESGLVQALDDAALDCQASDDWSCGGADPHGLQVAKDGVESLSGEGADPAPEELQFRTGDLAYQMIVFISDEEAASLADGASPEDYRSSLSRRARVHAITPGSACDGLPETTGYDQVVSYEETQMDLCADDLPARAVETVHDVQLFSTPLTFPKTPISPSIAMWLDGQSVPRSMAHGFDYSPSSNAISFFGDYRPRELAPDQDIFGFAHYQYFR
jgi:hypothetical protein